MAVRMVHRAVRQLGTLHAGSVTHADATLEVGSKVLENVELGAGVHIGANAVVGPDVCIGEGSSIGAGASVSNCKVGRSTVIHPGARIGQDGFGFVLGEDGAAHTKKPQVRGVRIGDNVEIGANTCIDRGSWRDTSIGDGVKIDNLVQIGHNVVLGRNCVVAAACGIGGSVTAGDSVFIGAMSGILQHTTIGTQARIAARSAVMNNVPARATVGGTPAMPIQAFHRSTVALRRLARRRPR